MYTEWCARHKTHTHKQPHTSMQIWYNTRQAVWLKRRFLFQLNSTVSSSTSCSTETKTQRTESMKRGEYISLKPGCLHLHWIRVSVCLYLWSCRKSQVWKPGSLWSAPPQNPEWETDSCRMRSADWPETLERSSAGEGSGIEWRTHLQKTSTGERMGSC